MYGTQTVFMKNTAHVMFENDVKMYGTQTISSTAADNMLFENDVKMYGTQTVLRYNSEQGRV